MGKKATKITNDMGEEVSRETLLSYVRELVKKGDKRAAKFLEDIGESATDPASPDGQRLERMRAMAGLPPRTSPRPHMQGRAQVFPVMTPAQARAHVARKAAR